MDDIRGMLDRLSDLSEDELSNLEDSIIRAFESIEGQEISRDTVAEMTFLADSVESVRAEMARREEEKAELANEAAEAATRISAEAAPATQVEETASTEPPATFATEGATLAAAEEDEEAGELPAENTPEEEVAEGEAPAVEAPVEEAPVEEIPAEEIPAAEAPTEEAPAEGEVPEEGAPEEEEKEPVFATSEGTTTQSTEAHMGTSKSEPTFSAPADRLPTQARVPATPMSLVAGGDIPGVTAGSALNGRMGLAEAFSQRLHSLRRASGGNGEQVVVASMLAKFPEERTLRTNEMDTNSAKIKSITDPQIIVASGGWCAPLPVNYDMFDIGGSTATPLRDSLPTFNADRGGVRYITPPVFTDYSGAFTTWTNTDDVEVGEDPVTNTQRKASLTVQCVSETSVYLDAVTMSMCFGNLQTRAFPELIARHNDLALIYAARYAESYVATKIKALSTALTLNSAVLGTARDILIAVERASVAYRYKYRLDPALPLRFVAPQWLHAMIRSDLTAQLPGDGVDTTFSLADASIDRFFTNRNIRPVWTLEGPGTAPTSSDYPDTVEWGLFAEGTFTLLDGGTLDIGIVRDMDLVKTNDYCTFTEQFLAVAKTGLESVWATQKLNVNGASAGTLDVSAVDY